MNGTAKCALSILMAFVGLCSQQCQGEGLIWPTNQLLPTFSKPVPVLDCIDVTSVSGADSDLFASLQGIVNRKQPRVACVVGGQEGKFTWLDLHNLPYTVVSGYDTIIKYRTNVTGLVVTDPNQPHTLNLATTIAGVKDELICDPSQLAVLTNAPYSFKIIDDLRGRFSDKYQVYRYLYDNFWSQCTHRIISGMNTSLHGNFRDYIVAVKSATLWLDPANASDKSVLALFLADMKPADGVYAGWWPSEANGLNWIYQYGIPVLASDFLVNASVFSGVTWKVNVPDIPPPPPLQNKVYVSMLLSDGDNIQYMQHAMKVNWDNRDRGSIPIGWTVSPLALNMDPVMLNYYWSTATVNDCLISGPSGAGYTHMQKWSAAHLAAFTRVSAPYLQRSGLRIITIWDQVTTAVAQSFAANCPTLLGLTDQSGGNYTSVNQGLRTIGMGIAYSSSTNSIYSGIVDAAKTWDGTAPRFIAVQANVWDIGPTQLRSIANSLDTNKYVLVRPDHLFLLCNSVFGYPSAVTKAAVGITASSATLQGFVTPNATNTMTWFQLGTNSSYGSKSPQVKVSTNTLVSAVFGGLVPRRTYHYRVVASNALGVAYGSDRVFTTGNRLKAWGDGSQGQTNVPAGLTNVVGISCGAYHGLALKNDGNVVSWGSNSHLQTNVPASLWSVVAIAGGAQHSLALLSNGTVSAWGDDTYGKANIPAGLNNVVSIAAGADHSLALKTDRRVTAWGDRTFDQTNVPSGLDNVVAIAAGGYHSLALRADGTVTAWGRNNLGQATVPAGLTHVVDIAAGQYHSVAIKADGASLASLLPARRWVADDLSGSDGTPVVNWMDSVAGTKAAQASATRQPKLFSNVLNGHNVVRFGSGGSHCLAVSASDSPISSAGSFALVVVFKTSTSGSASSLFYQNTGLLGCEQPNIVPDWALCINGSQLGAGLGGGTAAGADLSLYGGNVIDNKPHIAMYVRLGDTVSLYVDGIKVASQSSLSTVARGNYSFQIGAMTANNTFLFFSGDIAEIQLYDRGLNSWEIMSVGEILAATYGVTSGVAGKIVAWGNNSSGQTNVPAAATNLTAVACGSTFNVACKENETITGWGSNIGTASATAGFANISALAAGAGFGVAIANQRPLVKDTTVAGYVNHDLTVTLPGWDPDENPLNFRVLSLPAHGELYQYSDGLRGPLVSEANFSVSDPAGRLIFAPSTNEMGNAYATFTYKVENSYYSSDVAQVAVNIGLPAVPQFSGSMMNMPNSSEFELNFLGSSNVTYSLLVSTNLTDWNKVGIATEVSPGCYKFVDEIATSWPCKFYRASAP